VSKISQSVVALGTFDGVHKGHHQIINTLLKEAQKSDATPIIVTFFPHPTHVLTPEKPLKMLNSLEERKYLLKDKGIPKIVVKEFTKEFSRKSAYDFVKEELVEKLHIKTLIVGYDHSFGKNKEGDFDALQTYGKEFGFNVVQIEAFIMDKETVSSTLIRNLLKEGQIQKANQFLDYKFCLFGKVVKGNQLGRKIGFKTANIVLDYPNKIVPKIGVYVVESIIENKVHYGMMNIGYRPTIQGKTRTIEVHYFDIEKNLYDQNLKVKVHCRLRNELKFENLEALKIQLAYDKKEAIKYLQK